MRGFWTGRVRHASAARRAVPTGRATRIAALALSALLTLIAAARSAAETPAPRGAAAQQQLFVELHREAEEAHRAGDAKGLEDRMRRALELRPGHPRTLYNLAAALALQERADEVFPLLRRLAAMKLAYAIESDEDFAALKASDEFQALAARFRALREVQGRARLGFAFGGVDFMPEGIAYDPDSQDFFVSSVRRRLIVRYTRDGREEPLMRSGAHGLWSALGMSVEAPLRRLWVATTALPEMLGYEDELAHHASILAFDLEDGRLRARYRLPVDGRPHVLGDVIVGKGGALYTSDSADGVLYRLHRDSGRFEALNAPGALVSPQGLVLDESGKVLFLADYALGLLRLDLESGVLTPLAAGDDICQYGIDGLYRHGNRLIAIQNGTRPQRVMRFDLDATGTRVTAQQLLLANHPDFAEPTLGVVVRDRFHFVANSQWNHVDDKHRLIDEGQLRRPVILTIELD